MDTYLTITEASQMVHQPETVLKELVESGKIKSIMVTTGEYLINQNDILRQVPLSQRPEYAAHAHLAGNAISISDAAKKYAVSTQTISRWVARGYITRLGTAGKSILIDEAEIATYSDIYNASSGGQGKWVFRKGIPYQKKK